ncbi:hypothetical protein Y032_0087g2099 [Ancylostoma ceylanicum]|uniref:Uncharacterized protein n=1 Tax=Ancylostoma ceylanicum TaxID=53326 RepID=A0A016TQ87_9BILA|nr:hypothetical protein Y032_0087g2099 [Ancylostoma ceylanicum]
MLGVASPAPRRCCGTPVCGSSDRDWRSLYCLFQKLERFNVLRVAAQSAFYPTSNYGNFVPSITGRVLKRVTPIIT